MALLLETLELLSWLASNVKFVVALLPGKTLFTSSRGAVSVGVGVGVACVWDAVVVSCVEVVELAAEVAAVLSESLFNVTSPE